MEGHSQFQRQMFDHAIRLLDPVEATKGDPFLGDLLCNPNFVPWIPLSCVKKCSTLVRKASDLSVA